MKLSFTPPETIQANKYATLILWALLISGAMVLFFLSLVDQNATLWMRENGSRWWGLIMHRSIFRGEGLGGSDALPFVWLISLFWYILSYKSNLKPETKSQLNKWRPTLGYMVFTPILGMTTIHSLKWAIGRTRPHEVWNGSWPFTQWNEFGAHFISDGLYSGSFPSGHTGSVVVLLTLFYALFLVTRKRTVYIFLQCFFGLFIIAWSIGMALGRAITADHWLTDSLGIILPLWALVHAIYFQILKIPQQQEFHKINGVPPNFPKFWELRLMGQTIMIALGCILIIWWLRSFQYQLPIWYNGLVLPGVLLTTFFGHALNTLYQKGLAAIFETKP